MVLDCLAITLVFALTCGAVLTFMKFCGFDPALPKRPSLPPRQRDRALPHAALHE
jgi:hypothetical protein